ncbi:hypothetical protein GGQ74_001457 [Desulfobaculum xiamenense]|uniref:HD/PDEase domain-containing protein n=1 Tax=Desulfobaculum xiamenense TaxID=995050 RepID=A0A846QKW6_9BACT|nr:HD domain-containing protein [Desulfobaculum xiamenense]NJB67817.1 hypothetical protein [Desulfobaculum xiamenense]
MPQNIPVEDVPHLYDLLNPADASAVIAEVERIHRDCGFGSLPALLKELHADTLRLFAGRYPGYRASNTSYHDLEHTLSVVLASARLLHGIHLLDGDSDPDTFALAILGSYFHDMGLLQENADTEGSGAKYTVGHEDRSITLMRSYLSARNVGEVRLAELACVIDCTRLTLHPKDIPFPTRQSHTAGRIVGSADLIAQIADRNYLEKLLLLFQEFREAGLPGFDSELDLLAKTQAFYDSVARPRLDTALGGMRGYMHAHFKKTHGLDCDLYQVSIRKNLRHLRHLVETCGDSFDCFLKSLKRNGIGGTLHNGK